MIRSKLWSRAFATAVAFAAFTTAAAAQITPEQQSAIRGSCRSDFMSKCSGVTPGGKEALQCLQTNVASLSPACKTAVSATIPAATPPLAAPPRPTQSQTPPPSSAPPPAAAPAAPAPVAAPAATPASPPAAPTVRQVPPKPAQLAKPAGAPRQPAMPPPAPVAAPAAPAPPAPPPVTAPKSSGTPNAPIVMTAVIGRACLRDLALHCRGIKVGDGRKIDCLMARRDKLAVMCKAALKITDPVR